MWLLQYADHLLQLLNIILTVHVSLYNKKYTACTELHDMTGTALVCYINKSIIVVTALVDHSLTGAGQLGTAYHN